MPSSSSSTSSSSCPAHSVRIPYYVDNTNKNFRGELTWGVNPKSMLHNDNNNNDNNMIKRLRLTLQQMVNP